MWQAASLGEGHWLQSRRLNLNYDQRQTLRHQLEPDHRHHAHVHDADEPTRDVPGHHVGQQRAGTLCQPDWVSGGLQR